jgi:flagellar biosynthesis protein FlhG
MFQQMSYDAPKYVVPHRHSSMMHSVVNRAGSSGMASRDNAMQVIAVTGGKGGVGKTNIAVNMAVSMSMEGLDVMLFDADLGLANVDIILGMQIKHTLADVISGNKGVADVVVDGPEGLRVIPAASGVAQMVEMQRTDQETLIRQLSDQLMPPDVLIVDTGAGIDQTVQTFVAACQTAVLVVCDEPASLTDAYALMKVMRAKKDVRRFEILANQVDTPIQGKQLFERIASVCDRYLDVELGYLGGVPSDMYLRRAVQERKALVSAYPRSPAANAIRDVSRRLNRQAPRSQSSGVGFFVEQLLRQQSNAPRH